MSEKILANSEQYNTKKHYIIVLISALLLCIILFVISCDVYINEGQYAKYTIEYKLNGRTFTREDYLYDNIFEWIADNTLPFEDCEITPYTLWLLLPTVIVVIATIVYFWLRSYEMVITDKRVYGVVAFGKRVDLPLDLISASATTTFLHSVVVFTSSGKIYFRMMKNNNEMYAVLRTAISERQESDRNEH